MSKVEERLSAMSLKLPTVPTPLGNYVVAKTVGTWFMCQVTGRAGTTEPTW